jgi:hypothetical protein
MNRFTVMLMALGLAFFSGWLFANEIAPPSLDNASLAMWALTGVVSLVGAAMVSARG